MEEKNVLVNSRLTTLLDSTATTPTPHTPTTKLNPQTLINKVVTIGAVFDVRGTLTEAWTIDAPSLTSLVVRNPNPN